MKRHRLIILSALALLAMGAAQQIIITQHPQGNGVTCYVFGAALSCAYSPAATLGTPAPSATPNVTILPTQNRTTSPTGTRTATATTIPPSATPTRTLPPPSPTQTRVAALLVNGDFEAAWSTGWTRFDLWPELPNFNDERGDPRSRHGGAQSLRIYNEYRCWLAGVRQTVAVPQFSTVRFSAWARTWPTTGFNFDLPPDLSVTDGVAVGIDNSGGTDPTSSGIVWVEATNTEVWRQVSVQTVALAPRVTVFIRVRLGVAGVNNCQWPLPVLMGFVDDATLEIVP